MAPEFNPGVAKDIIKRGSNGKFVREGDVIWVEEGQIHHKDIAGDAGFNSVDDAGLFSAPAGSIIAFLGTSQDFNTRKNGPARDETIKVAQKIVGDSVRIL